MKDSAGVLFFSSYSRWRQAAVVLCFLWLTILVLFRETAASMVSIWISSGTYAHGFIVLPISLWLVWRKRDSLAQLVPQPSYAAIILLAISGFFWLLGELAEVNVVPQFALVFMLLLSVIAVLGIEISKKIAFPLFFLLFAVPFGGFTQPKLMEWTAKFTVLGLRFSGVPVYSEGQQIVIPTGTWSVVEACSGVRYLIASVTVGTLYAYLTYKSLFRRLMFVCLSFLVPIFANWARAYIIVMLGHLSGNKLAVGVDHLIYGWLFFGLVIGVMFWIGARWHEDDHIELPSPMASIVKSEADRHSLPTIALAGLIAIIVWPLALQQLTTDHPSITSIAPLDQFAGWTSRDHGLPEFHPKYENYSASKQLTFENNQKLVGLFVAAYRNQDKKRRLVTSTNVLVDSDDPLWSKVSTNNRSILFDEKNLQIRVTELRSVSDSRLIVWQWYWINGKWTSSDLVAKFYTAYSRLIGHRDDSAVIIIYALKDSIQSQPAFLDDFVKVAAPAIESMLEQTMSIE